MTGSIRSRTIRSGSVVCARRRPSCPSVADMDFEAFLAEVVGEHLDERPFVFDDQDRLFGHRPIVSRIRPGDE